MRITNFCGMDFLSTVPVLRFFTKTGVGEVSKLCDFFRCWWPPPRCREGGKSRNFFWSTFWLKWFFYFIVFVWLPWNSRPALQISWPVPSPGLSCPGQWPPRMCWTHPLDWWYNHQVDNALCLKIEWENFKDSGLILPSLMCPERGREKLIYCE